jgi:retinol dehydrogenase 14
MTRRGSRPGTARGRQRQTPEQGAATSIYLASSPQAEGITGTYFAGCKPKTSSRSSSDTATAARLWQISLDLVAPTASV